MQALWWPDHVGNSDQAAAQHHRLARDPVARRVLRSLPVECSGIGSGHVGAGDGIFAPPAPWISASLVAWQAWTVWSWRNGAPPYRAGAVGLENSADVILKPAGRRPSGDVSRRSRQRPGRSAGTAGLRLISRRLLVVSLAAAVFLVGFICDTGALARLFWAALAGQVGLMARLGAFAALLLLAGVFGLGFFSPARSAPAKPRRSGAPRAARNEEKATRTKAADSDSADAKPAVARSRRKKPGPVLHQSS